MGENVQEFRSITGQVQNRQREVKNSLGNGEAKGFTCTTHGHEVSGGGELLEGREKLGGGGQRGKKWDNCNSIINKIYFKNYFKKLNGNSGVEKHNNRNEKFTKGFQQKMGYARTI